MYGRRYLEAPSLSMSVFWRPSFSSWPWSFSDRSPWRTRQPSFYRPCRTRTSYFLLLAFDFLLIGLARLPIPTRFFSATTEDFREPTSFHVAGVSPEIFLEGRHFLTPLVLLLPQGRPFWSVHFSANHRLRSEPFLVLRMAIISSSLPASCGTWLWPRWRRPRGKSCTPS